MLIKTNLNLHKYERLLRTAIRIRYNELKRKKLTRMSKLLSNLTRRDLVINTRIYNQKIARVQKYFEVIKKQLYSNHLKIISCAIYNHK